MFVSDDFNSDEKHHMVFVETRRTKSNYINKNNKNDFQKHWPGVCWGRARAQAEQLVADQHPPRPPDLGSKLFEVFFVLFFLAYW